MVIEAFCSVFDMLDEPFHQVLQFGTIHMMLKPQPFASVIVQVSAICENRFPTIPSLQLLEELLTNENRPFPR
jgi:hypothetical protein